MRLSTFCLLFDIYDISVSATTLTNGVLNGTLRKLCLVVEVAVAREDGFQLLLLLQPLAEL